MAQWKGIKTLMRDYGISKKDLFHILEKREVACSEVAGVTLVDKEGLAAYIDALKQMAKKTSLVNVLQKALRTRKGLELDETERAFARKLNSRLSAINNAVIYILFSEWNNRQILVGESWHNAFLLFAKGQV